MKPHGFFDAEERLARLSGLGNRLETLSRIVDFEVFLRPDLDKTLTSSDGSKGGRPAFDPALEHFPLNLAHIQQL
ncbi:transposase [Acetobacter orleanensis]|nr:transposase [Acetobacter orleanensis]